MKGSLATSAVLHALVLGFGLVSLSGPKPFEVADIESLPVDIVPIESITQIQQGDKKSTVNEKPAPLPTQRPDIVPEATRVGENSVDTQAAPTPEPKPREVKAAAVPEPSPIPVPKPVEDEPVEMAEAEPTPVPATEMAAEPAPREEVKPDPVSEAIAAQDASADALALPENAPAPAAKPQPPKAQTAKAPERKEAEKPVRQAAAKPKSTERSFDADEVAALLNKEKASGGGAKRATREASLGGDKTTAGETLTQSEMDALRGQVQRCWNIPAGAAEAENLRVSVKFKLDRSGALEGAPEIIAGGGAQGVERAAAEAARRAVSRCAPYTLPAEKYESWANVIVNFDPREMY